MAYINSPHSSPTSEQVPNIPRVGIKILSGLPEDLPEQGMTLFPVVPEKNNDIFLCLYSRADVEALNDCATVTSFMKRGIGFVV